MTLAGTDNWLNRPFACGAGIAAEQWWKEGHKHAHVVMANTAVCCGLQAAKGEHSNDHCNFGHRLDVMAIDSAGPGPYAAAAAEY